MVIICILVSSGISRLRTIHIITLIHVNVRGTNDSAPAVSRTGGYRRLRSSKLFPFSCTARRNRLDEYFEVAQRRMG